jgi:hypothetical protein
MTLIYFVCLTQGLVMFFFGLSLLLLGVLGYLAQSIGLCMVRGVNEAIQGKAIFLIGILLSGVMSWVSVVIAYYLTLPVPFISYGFSVWAMMGGLLFGMGAALNNGCGVSTISKLARGQLAMLCTILGWLLGWLLLARVELAIEPTRFELTARQHYGLLALISVLTLLFMTRLKANDRRVWFSLLMIGLTAGLVFLTEPHWTPSGLLKDLSHAVWFGDASLWPSSQRFALIAALVTGMAVSALRSNTFSVKALSLNLALKHVAAGIMMGLGAALASGGNDSQLLLGLPSFSPAAFTSVFAMIVGIALGLRLSKAVG